jgi:transcriptional regulator with XRE-family HTH domain
MESKKTFGAYILRRRKELGLTQREFADRLYVTESAVSKWERGLSYPDITLIRDICAILQVSEHELLTASEDVEARNAETLAKRYLRLLRNIRLVQYILYGGTLAICLICNLAVDHTLSWFWIVLTALALSASLTLVPVVTEKHRGLFALGAFTASLELLLLAACWFSGGDWFLLATLCVLFGMGAVFLPFVMRALPTPLCRHKAVLCLGIVCVLLVLLLWESCHYVNGEWFPLPALPGALLGMILPWAWVGIIRYTPLCRWWKAACCLACAAVLLPWINPLCDRLVLLGGGTVERLHGFWFDVNLASWADEWTYNENTLFLLWLGLVCAAAVCAVVALVRRRGGR